MSEQQQRQDKLLDGYVTIRAEDGQHYLVPHFMIPATHQALNAYHQKLDLDVRNADGGVSFVYFTSVEVKVSGRSHVLAAPAPAPGPARSRVLPAPVSCPLPCPTRSRVLPAPFSLSAPISCRSQLTL